MTVRASVAMVIGIATNASRTVDKTEHIFIAPLKEGKPERRRSAESCVGRPEGASCLRGRREKVGEKVSLGESKTSSSSTARPSS